MKTQDLRDANRLWNLLGGDTNARPLAKTLASQLRATGLESTLRWLEEKNEPLGRRLCEVLDIPWSRTDRGQRSNLDILSDNRRALAIAEALHVVARADRRYV